MSQTARIRPFPRPVPTAAPAEAVTQGRPQPRGLVAWLGALWAHSARLRETQVRPARPRAVRPGETRDDQAPIRVVTDPRDIFLA